ncbi:hypothetical protein [Streptomyces ochraceiscleroticus]|uniref:Lipoprotein n=1 Tax=Streptomyces ochraceiscleroticus TaxID=47761 RepID=A0ABW1MUS7_9ACTN|nr:hypothetical protein [Streptomyces ochraceiscleroticus]
MNAVTEIRQSVLVLLITAGIVWAATLLLAGCNSTDSGGESVSPSASATRTYDAFDCRALLERNYENDEVRDASDDSECEGLTSNEYTEVVKDVITGHKDEILDRARDETVWDEAWEGTAPSQQTLVCDRLAEDGATVVGDEMADAAGDEASGEEVEMAQYFLDEKC